MSVSRLWLVRHAQPLIAPGVCYGRLDVPADDAASRQAAQSLRLALPHEYEAWHSPLQRCKQLERHLRAQPPVFTSTPEPRLMELDFGRWEGLGWEQIGKSAVDAWSRDLAGHAPGGGEPLRSMLARVHDALRTMARRGAGAPDMVWITHAGVIRCVQWLLAHGSRLPTAGDWRQPAPAFGQWITLPLQEISREVLPQG